MTNILTEILAYKRTEVAVLRTQGDASDLLRRADAAPPPRGFYTAMCDNGHDDLRIIAEIKRASPSKGLICPNFDVAAIARAYEAGGATCLSVLTDIPSFQGHPDHLTLARASCALPILRKDFIIDPIQIIESRALGADAILLIMSILDDAQIRNLIDCAATYQLDVLIEVHDATELTRAAALKPKLIGINNRDLTHFTTTLETTARLAPLAPPEAHIISESGITTRADIDHLCQYGVRRFLVGEHLMRANDIAAATRALISG